jgi:hypothetical protein
MRVNWRRVVVAVVVVIAVLSAVSALVLTNPARPIPFPGPIEVDRDELWRHVHALTHPEELPGMKEPGDREGVGEEPGRLTHGEAFRHFANLEALARVAAYIEREWGQHGFEVSRQHYQVRGNRYTNLMIAYGPADAPRVVLGAHYDVCGDQDGADDNASGVAAILELARLLGRHRPDVSHRIDLVAFTLEEPPFYRTEAMGSAVYAKSLAEAGVEVRAMIALDMIGFYSEEPGSQGYPLPVLGLLYPSTADFACVVGNLGGLGVTRAVKARLAGSCGVDVYSINAPAAVPGIDFSDHLNFWRHGYPAVMVTDSAFYRNPNYHCPTDTIETLDFERMTEVVRGLYATIVTLD